MRFSQRIGKKDVRSTLQVDSMDEDLRNRIWNAFINLKAGTDLFDPYSESTFQRISRIIWEDFFNYPLDTLPVWRSNSVERVDSEAMIEILKKWYFKAQWFEIFDLIEFISHYNLQYSGTSFDDSFNFALKKDMSAYRIVKGAIVQITSEEEIIAIENAITSTDEWKSVNTHLTTALTFLSDRKSPNYRNSIKESISAVEAFCKIIAGNESASLGEALREIEKKHDLHPALKKSFSSLYGYTSDSSGIRHALIETDGEVELEDAKFMLISCSAFINFLKAKYIS